MTDVSDALISSAATLNQSILDSPIYQRYLQAKAQVEKDPVIFEALKSFKSTRNALGFRRMAGEMVSDDEEFALMNSYSDIDFVQVCTDYLNAESQLLALLKKMTETLLNHIDIDTDL